jgi:hypothetical protein
MCCSSIEENHGETLFKNQGICLRRTRRCQGPKSCWLASRISEMSCDCTPNVYRKSTLVMSKWICPLSRYVSSVSFECHVLWNCSHVSPVVWYWWRYPWHSEESAIGTCCTCCGYSWSRDIQHTPCHTPCRAECLLVPNCCHLPTYKIFSSASEVRTLHGPSLAITRLTAPVSHIRPSAQTKVLRCGTRPLGHFPSHPVTAVAGFTQRKAHVRVFRYRIHYCHFRMDWNTSDS